MMRICLGAICALVLFAASCGGGGSDPVVLGRIAGTLSVVGPTPGIPLKVGLASAENDTIVASIDAGPGGTVPFNFFDIVLGDYYVLLYSEVGPAPTVHFETATYNLTEDNAEYTNETVQFSFLGGSPATWGTISGLVQVAGDWPADPAKLVFVGITRVGAPGAPLVYLVGEDDVNEGWIAFNLEGIAPGSYNIGFFGYKTPTIDPPYGLEDDVVVVGSNENVTNVVFGADFAGDPGTDPVGNTISGTVSFNGALPAGLFYYVAANTIPPQQGAPPSTFFVAAAAAAGGSIDYTLPGLPDGDYSVSIFSYNITTHQATYFGEFASTVSVSGGEEVVDIDFAADVSGL